MPLITLDLSEKANGKVKHYMADHPAIQRKSDAIIKMLEAHK